MNNIYFDTKKSDFDLPYLKANFIKIYILIIKIIDKAQQTQKNNNLIELYKKPYIK